MSLLTILKEKLSNNKAAKYIATFAVASVLAITPITMSACTKDNNTNNNPSYSDGDTTTPGGNTENPDDDTTNPSEDTESGYSDILNAVLGAKYKDILADILSTPGKIYISSQKVKQHPYGFLESAGHDIEAIKNYELDCLSTAYFMGNDTTHIYVSTNVEGIYNDREYYTNYVLKYSITDKEYKELTALYEYASAYAPFWMQELSYQKTPTIISEAKITVSAYDNLQKNIANKSETKEIFGEDSNIEIDFTGFSVEGNEFYFNVRSYSGGEAIVKDCEQHYLTLKPAGSLGKVSYIGDNIFASPSDATSIKNSEEYKANSDAITYYDINGRTAYKGSIEDFMKKYNESTSTSTNL